MMSLPEAGNGEEETGRKRVKRPIVTSFNTKVSVCHSEVLGNLLEDVELS